MKRLLLCTLVFTLCPTMALGQPNDGSIGIFADPQGTTPCLQVPPMQGAVLYIVATVAGGTASGISGAEFRIEVADPTGWMFIGPTYYNNPTIVGNPMDYDPADPGDGSGVTLSYNSCRVPDSTSTVLLGHITVLNFPGSGVPTDIFLKRHSVPNNATYPCPLLTICDAPKYTKFCMDQSTVPPCTTLTPKPVEFDTDDAPVSSLALNRTPEPTDVSRPFTETVLRGNSALWVLGMEVEEPEVSCHFDGTNLMVGPVTIDINLEPPQPTDTERQWLYRNVPFVQTRLAEGRPIAECAAEFWAETNALIQRSRVVYARGGAELARETIESSALVEDVEIDESAGTYKILYRGFRGRRTGSLESKPSNPPPSQDAEARREAKARALTDAIRSQVGGDQLVLVTRGAVFAFRGLEREAVQTQIDHVLQGGDLEALPPGPLRALRAPLNDIVKAAEGSQ